MNTLISTFLIVSLSNYTCTPKQLDLARAEFSKCYGKENFYMCYERAIKNYCKR